MVKCICLMVKPIFDGEILSFLMLNSAFSPRFVGGVSSRISPWVALPLLPICPVAAGAVALAATLRNRAWLGTVAAGILLDVTIFYGTQYHHDYSMIMINRPIMIMINRPLIHLNPIGLKHYGT